MRDVSIYYKNLVKNTYRPRCDPTIIVKSKDGATNSYTFKSSNIVELKINQKIDVLGKELPTIELEWSTFYNSQNNYSQMMYCPVALTFSQSLGPYTWRNFYDNYTWKTASEELTWKDLATKELTTDIDFCTLFISEEPTINGDKIIFKARHALYFLNAEVNDKIYGSNLVDIKFRTPIREFLESAKNNIPKDATALKQTIDDSATSIYGYFGDEELLDCKIQVSSDFKDFLKNYLCLKNAYIYLNSSGSFQAKKFSSTGYVSTDYTLDGNLMFNKPTVQEIPKVSVYENTYNYFDNSSDAWLKGTDRVFNVLNVDNGETFTVDNGETFTEKNPLWGYRELDFEENQPNILRAKHIDTYYYAGGETIEVECLPNLAIEMGDVIKVKYRDISNRDISNDVIVVKSELTYNGAFREKIYLHTMKGEQ